MSLLSGTEKTVLGTAGLPHSQKTPLLISAFEIITPGGNSYCEGSIIDIQKRIRMALRHTMSLQMAQTRPLNLV